MNKYEKSEALFAQACRYIPGGVNSPVRAFKSVGRNPIYIDHGKGGHIIDVDGNEYVDYISSWGPLILGHANPLIQEAIRAELEKGTSYGACNAREVEMAALITQFFPSVEKVRMVNSGTEATMSAIRLARGYTGKDKIIKFDGCYHGHSDSFLIQAGSGLATFGTSGSAGVTDRVAQDTLVATYNDLDSVEALLKNFQASVAAIILEPVMGNMGCILPAPHFLQGLRSLADQYGVLLIFDEVISGFRMGRGGAQGVYGIQPDLTCMGKIIGGGLPVGAFGGKKEIMDALSPNGPVYQAGTLSGNPLAMAAGIAMLQQLSAPDFYDRLEERAAKFEQLIRPVIEKYPEELSFNRAGSLCTLFFKPHGVASNADAKQADTQKYAQYFNAMLEKGIYLPPAQFECMFISVAHTDEDFEKTAKALSETLAEMFG